MGTPIATDLTALGQVSNEGNFSTNVVIELVGFGLINGLLHDELVHEPTHKAVIIEVKDEAALGSVYQRPQVAQKIGVHGNT